MKTKAFLLTGLFLLIAFMIACNALSPNRGFQFLTNYQKNPDGTVTFTLSVRNESLKEIELISSSSQLYDIEVYENPGVLVWNWAHDKSFLALMTSITLQPGEERVFRETWDVRSNDGQPVVPGNYRVRTHLVTKPSASYSFDITL